MIKVLVLLTLFTAGAMAEDLGSAMTSTATRLVAPNCNSPVFLQRNPACAFGTTKYLVVWSDGKQQPVANGADIYCSRVEAATGNILDPNGILVCHAADIQDYPAVAFDGTNFLVVWEDVRNRKDVDVYGARISEAGQLLDAQAFPISAQAGVNEVRPTVAFAGGNYFVAWSDSRKDTVNGIYGIYGARVSPAGVVLDPQGIALAVESDANIAGAIPATNRFMYSQNQWQSSISSNVYPVLVSNGKNCLLSYDCGKPRVAVFYGSNTFFGVIDPATGSFVRGPESPLWIYRYHGLGLLAATSTTNGGWAVARCIHAPGWGADIGYKAICLDSLLVSNASDSTTVSPTNILGSPGGTRGGLYSFKPAIGALQTSALTAMDFAWWGTDKKMHYAILLNRISYSSSAYLETSAGIALDEHLMASDTTVMRPALCNGPNKECLLVYEKDAGINNGFVVSKIIREK